MSDSTVLSEGLKNNAQKHQSYKIYTSMDRALAFLLDGRLYVTDGAHWNDVSDSKNLEARSLYATCFSCSTRENIAMWMLYGGSRGKNGALISLYPSIIEKIIESTHVALGNFGSDGKYHVNHILNRNTDFSIFLTDMLYVDPCKNKKAKVTCSGESVVIKETIMKNDDVFCKNIAWEYEKECRLVIRLSESWKKRAAKEKLNAICITLDKSSLNKMRNRGLTRSPIYCGDVEIGTPSNLTGAVKWEI